jgi:hypothetical protein
VINFSPEFFKRESLAFIHRPKEDCLLIKANGFPRHPSVENWSYVGAVSQCKVFLGKY